MGCLPCEKKRLLQLEKLPFLRESAKKRAKEQGIYYVIYNDTEDKIYRITSESNAQTEGFDVLEYVSPH